LTPSFLLANFLQQDYGQQFDNKSTNKLKYRSTVAIKFPGQFLRNKVEHAKLCSEKRDRPMGYLRKEICQLAIAEEHMSHS